MSKLFLKGNDGVTLIEAIIAVFLLAIMMLGATRAMMAINDTTTLSAIRTEGSRVADEVLTDALNAPYGFLGGVVNTVETRQIGNTTVAYNVQQTVLTEVPGIAKSVVVLVSWTFHGQNFSQSKSTIVGNI